MGVRERKLRDQSRLRRRILSAARDLFIRHGYENTSMRRIAERIEYSPTTIYLHFRDKAELMENVCEETFAGLVKKLEAVLARPADPFTSLKAGLRAYVEFGLENPNHYRVTMMMRHPHGQPGEPYMKPDTMGFRAYDILRQGVAACAAFAGARDFDAELASQLLCSGAHGITSLLITHEDFPWAPKQRLVRTGIEYLVSGLQAAMKEQGAHV